MTSATINHLHLQRGQLNESLEWLKQLFACAKPQNIRCHPVFDHALQLMQVVEGQLACHN